MTYPHTPGRYGYCAACALDTDAPQDCPAAMRAHIAELDRLQASIIKAQAAGYEAGRAEERAAVVASLRHDRDAITADVPTYHPAQVVRMREWYDVLDHTADSIERGEHVKETP